MDQEALSQALIRLRSGQAQSGDRELVQQTLDEMKAQGIGPEGTSYLQESLDMAGGEDWTSQLMDAPNAIGAAIPQVQNPEVTNPSNPWDAIGAAILPGVAQGALGGEATPLPSTNPNEAARIANEERIRNFQIDAAARKQEIPPSVPVAPAGVGGMVASAVDAFTPDPVATVLPDAAAAPSAALESAAMRASQTSLPGSSRSAGVLGEAQDVGTLDPKLGRIRADRGGGNDRVKENWKQMDESSAFAGVDPAILETMASDPHLAARQLSLSRGGSGAGANLLAPQMEAALNLNATGVLSGRHKLGGYESAADTLMAAENFVNEQGPGSYVDPQSIYRQTFRNVRHTNPEDMFTGEGMAGDINNQMSATGNALMAAAGASMTAESQNALKAKLENAQEEYILGVANGSISPEQMSYPEWLRTIKKARRWVGPGTTQDQWDRAF